MKSRQWHRKSKPARSIVPLSRFTSDTIFALKNGGHGCLFSLAGLDDEGLTDGAIEGAVARIHAALRAIPPDCRLYQYLRVRKGCDIPARDPYDDPLLDDLVHRRFEFLDKTAHFHRVDLFWCLTVEPAHGPASANSPDRQARRTAHAFSQLCKTAELLLSQLGDLLDLRLLSKLDIASFFSYLLNLEEWSLDRRFVSDHDLDRQLAGSSIAWHHDHLRIGKRFVQMFSLTDSPAGSRPNLFGPLQAIDADIIACAAWVPSPRADVRRRIGQIEGFIGFFRHKFLSLAANVHAPENLNKAVGAKAADKSADRLADVVSAVDNDGCQFGRYSFSLLAHSRDESDLRDTVPKIHRALVEAQAPYVEETLGNLAAYCAMLPGNSSGDAASNFNVRQFWLRDDHHADLALVFAPYTGCVHSVDLEHEYLNVYETRTGTPFFLDPYVDGMRTTLILGAPRTGKSVHGNQIIAFEQKYGGFTWAIDAGGSFESTIRLFRGAVEKVGVGHPRINPFLLEPTEENLNFLFGFVRLLLANGGAQLGPEDEDAIDKAIRRMYLVPANLRRLRHLLLPPHLERYLAKWMEGGVYGSTFDNVEGSLRLARIQCFDLDGITESQQDLIEPLLFWILRQIQTIMRDPANLSVPKHILFDKLWKHLRTRQLLEMALDALKTGGKHLAGATLLTQSAKDLGEHADLIVNACTTFLFLADPTFNRERYQRLFNLNDQEVLNLASLGPREALLKRPGFSKILRLNLDPKSYWLFSTKPKDRIRRQRAIEEFGFEAAFERAGIEQPI